MGLAAVARDAGPALQGTSCIFVKNSAKTDSTPRQTGRSRRFATEDLLGSPFLKTPNLLLIGTDY